MTDYLCATPKAEAFEKLCDLARSINPDLPADLSGRVVTITMSLRGQWACAHPRALHPFTVDHSLCGND